MAEGTPLERVQVVNSGARVQIPPSPFGSFAKQAMEECEAILRSEECEAFFGGFAKQYHEDLDK